MKEEIKKIADSIIGTDTIVEKSLENTFYIYTAAWKIEGKLLAQIAAKFEILNIFVDGYHLTIEVKQHKN